MVQSVDLRGVGCEMCFGVCGVGCAEEKEKKSREDGGIRWLHLSVYCEWDMYVEMEVKDRRNDAG